MSGAMWWAQGPPDGMSTNVDWSLLADATPLAVQEDVEESDKTSVRRRPGQSESILCLRSSSTWSKSQLGPGGRSARRPTLADMEHFHIKSRQPMSPSCGLVYMECQILQVTERASGTDSTTTRQEVGNTDGVQAASAALSAAPALIIGVCRKSLPLHKLPGEEPHGIGLSTRQRMVYSNSNSQAERIAMPLQGPPPLAAQLGSTDNTTTTSNTMPQSTNGASRALTAGDVVGCLVNFIDGTVAFTVNGQLLSFLGKLDHAIAKTGYYMALGLQGSGPALRLRVIFRGGNVSGSSNTTTRVGSATLFDLDAYGRRFAVSLIHRKDRRMFSANWAEPRLNDAAVTMLLREYLAARGLTSTLQALDHETRQLMPLAPAHTRRANEAEAYRRSALAHSEVLAEARRRLYATSHVQAECDQTSAEEDRDGGVLEHLRQRGILAPHLRQALAEALGGDDDECDTQEVGCHTAALHTAHFFAQRQDVLYVLSALQCVERSLARLDMRLAALQERLSEGTAAQVVAQDEGGWQVQGCLLRFTQHVLQPFAVLRAASTHKARLRAVLSQLASRHEATNMSVTPERTSEGDSASVKSPHTMWCDALESTTSSEDGEVAETSDELRSRFLALAQTGQMHRLTPGQTNSCGAGKKTATANAATLQDRRRRVAKAQFVQKATAALFQATTPHIAAPTRQAQLALAQSLDMVCERVWTCAQMVLYSAANASSDTHEEKICDVTLAWLGYWRLLLRGARRQYARHAWALLCHSIEDCNTQVAKLLRQCLATCGGRHDETDRVRRAASSPSRTDAKDGKATANVSDTVDKLNKNNHQHTKKDETNGRVSDTRARPDNHKSAVNSPLHTSEPVVQDELAQPSHGTPAISPETESEEGQSETGTTTQSHDEDDDDNEAVAANAPNKYSKTFSGSTLHPSLTKASHGKATGQRQQPRTVLEAYFGESAEGDEADEVNESEAETNDAAQRSVMSCGVELLPPMALTLRSLWRRTHAVAVLEPLQQLVANAFMDEIRKLSALPARSTAQDATRHAATEIMTTTSTASLLSPLKKERHERAAGEANSVTASSTALGSSAHTTTAHSLPDVAMTEACRIEEFRTTAMYLARIYKCLQV